MSLGESVGGFREHPRQLTFEHWLCLEPWHFSFTLRLCLTSDSTIGDCPPILLALFLIGVVD